MKKRESGRRCMQPAEAMSKHQHPHQPSVISHQRKPSLGGSVSRCGGELGEQGQPDAVEAMERATRSRRRLVVRPWYWAREPGRLAVFHPPMPLERPCFPMPAHYCNRTRCSVWLGASVTAQAAGFQEKSIIKQNPPGSSIWRARTAGSGSWPPEIEARKRGVKGRKKGHTHPVGTRPCCCQHPQARWARWAR
jgi:hypothetical protein